MTSRSEDARDIDVPDDLRGYRLLGWAIEQRLGRYRLGWAFASVADLLLRELAKARLDEDDRPELAIASVRRWCLREQSRDETVEDVRGVCAAIIGAPNDAGVVYSAMSYLLAFGPDYDNRPESDLYEGWLAMQHAGIALAGLLGESQAEGMERAGGAFRLGLAEGVVERRPNPPTGPEEAHLTVVETQSPDQGQPWRFAEGFYADDVPISDIAEGLAGRLAPATAVRVRVRVGDGPTTWLGVVNRRGAVVKAPPPKRDAFLGFTGTWEEGWEEDDAEWFFKNIECVEYGLLVMAAVECVEIARPFVEPGRSLRAFDGASAVIRARSEAHRSGRAMATSSEASELYNARLELSALTAGGPSSASRSALEAMRETCFLRRPDQCAPMIWRVPGLVVDAMSFGRGRSPRPSRSRKASLNAQMAAIVRAWVSIGVAMEAAL